VLCALTIPHLRPRYSTFKKVKGIILRIFSILIKKLSNPQKLWRIMLAVPQQQCPVLLQVAGPSRVLAMLLLLARPLLRCCDAAAAAACCLAAATANLYACILV
jgi:hypothetical protein